MDEPLGAATDIEFKFGSESVLPDKGFVEFNADKDDEDDGDADADGKIAPN